MAMTTATRLFVGASMAALIAGCDPQSNASPPPTPTPGPSLLAVLQSQPGLEPDTVAIIDLNGSRVAAATFQPRKKPYVGFAGVPLQAVATVVRAGVYYIDGYGTVRVLNPHAPAKVVASFPQQPEQFETWFAVSPDGARLLAGVYTFPAIGPPASDSPFLTLVGPSKFDLESSPAGGQAKTLLHFESHAGDAETWKPTFPIGWTAAGPVAMIPYSIATQNAWWGGPLYVIDDAGARTTRIGGSDCDSAAITPTGFIPCTIGGGPLTIRDAGGDILWTANEVQGYNALGQYVAPDGQAISDGDVVETRASGVVQMPQGFRVEGWLSSTAVIGRFVNGTSGEMGNLTWIKLNDPGTRHDLGLSADFVGTLPT